jgi:dolichyl-phosphate-mannose-protein mannosyltransferase
VQYVQPIIHRAGGNDFRNRTVVVEDKPRKHVPFLKKFAELQILMLQHNAGLTADHPYASGPFNWPFVLSGISFWTHDDEKKQIYFIGNVASWWLCVIGLSIFTGIMAADTLARRRGLDPIEDRKWDRMR